jgi:hypothetical protein
VESYAFGGACVAADHLLKSSCLGFRGLMALDQGAFLTSSATASARSITVMA